MTYELLKAAPPARVILPNIRRLDWGSDAINEHSPYINALLGTQIQSLQLSIPYCDTEALGSLLLSQHHLFHVTIKDRREGDVQRVNIISKAVCCWSQLRTLSVDELTPAAFANIAVFPDLQKLALNNVCKSEVKNFRGFAFPALRSLYITCDDMQFCIDVVEAVSSSCLGDVRFNIRRSSGWKHITDSLAAMHSFHTSLQKISLSDKTSGDPHDRRSGKDILSPLFVLSNLTSVYLDLRDNHHIDDNVMKTMSKAWPRLQRFSLLGYSAVTLLGLVPLANFCSELDELSLCFDACIGELLEDCHSEPWAGVQNRNHCVLDVKHSRIDNPPLVIKILGNIFPNLVLDYATSEHWHDPLAYEAYWLAVEEGLRANVPI